MTSETDAEFLDRIEPGFYNMADRDRLFTLARRGAAVQWRPIQEAARDGTRILCGGGGLDQVECCSYNERVGAWDCESFTLEDSDWEPTGYIRPTHWMPLPPPPAGETNE